MKRDEYGYEYEYEDDLLRELEENRQRNVVSHKFILIISLLVCLLFLLVFFSMTLVVKNMDNTSYLEQGNIQEEYVTNDGGTIPNQAPSLEENEEQEDEPKEPLSIPIYGDYIFLVPSTGKLKIDEMKCSENEIEFCEELIAACENNQEMLYDADETWSQNIWFEFINRNPYAEETNIHYLDSGYMKITNSEYLIYLNPSPIVINK